MDLRDMTNEQLATLEAELWDERQRRRVLSATPQAVAQLNTAYLAADGTTPGQPWRQPTGAHDAYPLGWTVALDGRTWESLIPANAWRPGTSGWREVVTAGDQPPQWVAPTGAHDAYNIGDRVTFEGAVYVSLIAANVWSPAVYPVGWAAQ